MLESLLFPVSLLGGVGLAAGLLLGLAARFLARPANPRLEQVRLELPGINCGACGYPGCDQYAKAVAEQGEALNRCVPGGGAVADALARVMDRQAEGVKNLRAFVACRGIPEEDRRRMHYEGINTCFAASQLFGGDLRCSYGCLGFGDCARACPYGAIDVSGGLAAVDVDLCTGCSLCVPACPKSLLAVVPLDKPVHVSCHSNDKGGHTHRICKNGCIACKKCAAVCPTDAITVENNLARIHPDLCIVCGKCVEVCPVQVIRRWDLPR